MHSFFPYGNLAEEKFSKYNNTKFSFFRDQIFLRKIKYNNLEILKMLSFLVRDKNWNNYIPKILNTNEYKRKNFIKFIFEIEYSDKFQKLIVNNEYIVKKNKLTFISNGIFKTDFWTNRIGFNILLPLEGVVGKKVIINKEKKIENSKFPEFISPNQPFYKFNKIEYDLDDTINTTIEFKGINFEMEDQRNWGDASYKIYSGSLLDPFPYKINKGNNFYQEINIYFNEKNKEKKSYKNKIHNIKANISNKIKMPKIGIKIEKFNEINFIKNLDYNFYYFIKDFEGNKDKITFRYTKKPIYLVALINHKENVKTAISKIYKFINKNKIHVSKLLICPKIYLNSFQPSGKWPKVPVLDEYYKASKKIFPNTTIVGGMVTNFTELNRKRPNGVYDIINFSLTPIIHDASDIGVMDSPENIPYILKTLNDFSNNTPIHIGPITLGMHFNPYGEKLAVNLNNQRLEMAEFDPRHDSLLGISWSVAVLSQLIDKNIKYMTFNSILGYHGIITDKKNKRPLYFFNEILLFFKDSDIYSLNNSKEIYGIMIKKNKKKYYLLTNVTNTLAMSNLIENHKINQSYLNINNFNTINENDFTFLNFINTSKKLKFEPYETKLIEVIK